MKDITKEDREESLRCKTVSDCVDYVDRLVGESKLTINSLECNSRYVIGIVTFGGLYRNHKPVEHQLGIGDIKRYQPEYIIKKLKGRGFVFV